MKIGHKLILVFVGITLLVGILIGYTSINISQKALREQIEKEPLIYNDVITRSLDVMVHNLIEGFKSLAAAPVVETAVIKSNDEFAALPDVQEFIDARQKEWTGVPKEEEKKDETKEVGKEPEIKKEEIKKEIKEELKKEIKAEITKEVGKEVIEKAKKAEARKDEIKEDIKEELKKEIKAELKAEARKESGGEAIAVAKEPEVKREELKKELKEELKEEIKEEIKKEVKKDIKAEVKKEAGEEVKKAVKKEEPPAFIEELMNNELSQWFGNEAKNYEKTYELENFGQILVANKYGAIIGLTRKTSEYRCDKQEWWQATKEKGLYVGEVRHDKSQGIYTLSFGIRLEDKEGNFVGTMLITPNINIINREIKERIAQTYKQVDLKLLNGKGRVIYPTSDTALMLKGFDLYKNIEESKTDKGSFMARDAEGDAKIFVYSRTRSYTGFEGLDWICVAMLSAKHVLEPVNELRNTIILISLIVIVVALVFGILVSRIIIGPVKRLTNAMVEISKGNFKVELPSRMMGSKDEIGELARSFSRMVAAIKFFKEEEDGKAENKETE